MDLLLSTSGIAGSCFVGGLRKGREVSDAARELGRGWEEDFLHSSSVCLLELLYILSFSFCCLLLKLWLEH